MSQRRPSVPTIIACNCFLLMAAGMTYQQLQLRQLHSSMEGTAEQVTLDSMLGRMNQLNDQVDGLVNRKLISAEDFQVAQQVLTERVNTAQASAKQAADAAQRLADTSASATDLLAIKADLQTVSDSVQALRRTPPKPVVEKPRPVAKPIAAPPPAPPPFQILGVEYRGGEPFLTIAPPGSTRLSQIYLIRPGDTVAGSTWQLRGIDGTSARFDVAGNGRTINLHP